MGLEGGGRGGPGPLAGATIAAAITLYGIIATRRARAEAPMRGAGRDAARPQDIPRRGWWEILQRTWARMGEDNISMLAAGVAFYALLAIFPALSALVSLYGLIADPHQVQEQVAAARGFLPAEAATLLENALKALVENPPGKLGIGLLVSVALALWSARTGTATTMTALNVAYAERERRNIIVFNLEAFALTGALVAFGIFALFCVAIVPALLKLLWLPEPVKSLIAFARWPVVAALVIAALAGVYRFAPSRAKPRWQWVSWGAAAATVLWLIGSALFSLYVAEFSSYDKTYGALGAVVILLMWFYLTAYVILFGAELNAEMEHQTARDTTTGPARPLGARGARMADRVAAPKSA